MAARRDRRPMLSNAFVAGSNGPGTTTSTHARCQEGALRRGHATDSGRHGERKCRDSRRCGSTASPGSIRGSMVKPRPGRAVLTRTRVRPHRCALRPIPIDWIGPSSASEMNYPAYAPHVAARLMQAAKRFRPRTFEDIIPEGIRRHSRIAGACIGGVGGCSWGGGQY
jgi:hypothetical protein